MKKGFAMLLAVIMMLFTACGGTSSNGHAASATGSKQGGTVASSNGPTVQFDPSAGMHGWSLLFFVRQ